MKRNEIENGSVPESDETIAVKSKKQKKTTDNHTIPILRGKFKQRWLAKHSSLIKRSDTASGILVSCGLHAETRALGQVQQALERHLGLYPSYESTWTRMEGSWDVEDLEKVDQQPHNDDQKLENLDESNESSNENPVETTETNDTKQPDLDNNRESRKDRTFQAVDAACGGLLFYRFRVNIKPTDFIDKMIDSLVTASAKDDEIKKKEQFLIRHCSRWMPLDYIMPATTERIDACFVTRVLPENLLHLPANTTVAIVTEIRNNTTISKQDLIDIIAPKLPNHLKVDLKRPQYVILVNIFKSVCGIGILKDYYQRKKYNIGALL